MSGEHPTDSVEHSEPDILSFRLEDKALMTVRTMAEATGVNPIEIISHALAIQFKLVERVMDGSTVYICNPDDTIDLLTFPYLKSPRNVLDDSNR